MKVLFINTIYGKGSTGRIIKEIGDRLVENGHEFTVAYGRGEGDTNCYKIGSKIGVLTHAFLSRITDKAGFYSSHSTKKLIDFIKKYDPDIIHLHNLHGYYLNITVLFYYLKNEYKGKVVWTLHDCWAFTGHCAHYIGEKCYKWKIGGCCSCPLKRDYPGSISVDNSKRNFLEKKGLYEGMTNLTIVTVSNWLKSEVEKSILAGHDIVTIYNGIDTEKFSYLKNDIKFKHNIVDKKLILLVSDGWNELKGFSTAKEIARKAPKDWVFIIIGLDKEQVSELPSNMLGFERIWNQQELIKYYSAADVFLNPSIAETFGLVTVEAISCGTPAVVVNSTASPELITSDDNGIVLEMNASVDDYIQAIRKCFLKKGKAQAKEFSKKKFLEGYINLYDRL